MRRPSRRDLSGWAIGFWVIVAAVLFVARVDPPGFRSDDWFLGPAVVFGIHQAWSSRTLALPLMAARAVGGAIISAAVLIGGGALAALIRPWALGQHWIDTALIATVVVTSTAVAFRHVSRESTARGRWISVAEIAVVPGMIAGLWMVSTLGPLTAPGIVLAFGSPLAGYWVEQLRVRDAALASAPDVSVPARS